MVLALDADPVLDHQRDELVPVDQSDRGSIAPFSGFLPPVGEGAGRHHQAVLVRSDDLTEFLDAPGGGVRSPAPDMGDDLHANRVRDDQRPANIDFLVADALAEFHVLDSHRVEQVRDQLLEVLRLHRHQDLDELFPNALVLVIDGLPRSEMPGGDGHRTGLRLLVLSRVVGSAPGTDGLGSVRQQALEFNDTAPDETESRLFGILLDVRRERRAHDDLRRDTLRLPAPVVLHPPRQLPVGQGLPGRSEDFLCSLKHRQLEPARRVALDRLHRGLRPRMVDLEAAVAQRAKLGVVRVLLDVAAERRKDDGFRLLAVG